MKHPEPNEEKGSKGDGPKPVTGVALWLIFLAVTLAAFLMALSASLIATVSLGP